MSISLRLSVRPLRALGALAFAALVAGCPTAEETPSAEEPPLVADEAGADVDAGPPPPPCSRLTTACPKDGKCEGAPDCASALCRDGVCNDVVPADGSKSGDETDIDCGGTAAPACADLKQCLIGADCTSGVCTANICQVPTFTDGVKNGQETGKDCGGPTANAPKCATGEGCLADNDCDKVLCDTFQKKCKEPAHDDGIKNLDETDVDCGGPTATVARCATGKICVATSDCDNVICNAMTKICDPPTKTDGLKNGTESDIDCGGGAPTNAPKCVINKKCVAGTDCLTGGCSVGLGNVCSPLSCATADVAGINSCGAIETGQAGAAAAHDSCCKSLVLPTRTTRRMDKYEITAGRFRNFLAGVGPNVRAWVQTYVAANPGSQLAQMLASFPVLANIYPAVDRFAALSLTAHMAIDIDNYNGIRGCADYAGSYSANTYWMDDTHYADFGLPSRANSGMTSAQMRLHSDEKSMNCAMPIMFTAFCAWDGGEMAKYDDYLDIWNQAYPWGPTDLLRPNYNWCGGSYMNGGFVCQCDGVHNIGAQCPAGGFNGLSGAGVFYEWPRNLDRSKDNWTLIGSPGRFVMDASAKKSDGESWFDLYANVAEYTADFAANGNALLSTFCDTSAGVGNSTCTRSGGKGAGTVYNGIPQIGMVGQSWEGHQYGKTNKASGLPATFQYGKFGARCVRPATPY